VEKITVPIQTTKVNEVINIVPIYDVHILNPTFQKKMYKQCIDFIAKTPNTYWFGGGDYGEFIRYTDKRFNPTHCYPDLKVKDLANIVDIEMKEFETLTGSILTPEKCFGLGEGNHDLKLDDGSGNIVTKMCNNHGLKNLGYSGYIKLTLTRGASNSSKSFKIYYHHGWSTARTSGAKVNYVEKMALRHDCHVAVTGHCHSRTTTGPIDVSTFDGPALRYGIICGAWKSGVDFGQLTWEETRGYEQEHYKMGTWIIQIIPFPSGGGPMIFRVIEFDPLWTNVKVG